MRVSVCSLLTLLAAVLSASASQPVSAAENPLLKWHDGVEVSEVDAGSERHSIHSYFIACPESPDGEQILFYMSTRPDAHEGELRTRRPASGAERVLVSGLHVEDAHRAACQQWVSHGKRIVYHDEREGEWLTAVIDLESGDERILARRRLTGWGRPDADLLPLYGLHWSPGEHRDLELVDVVSGEIQVVLTAEAVCSAYSDWIGRRFGERPVSIFFPVLNPQRDRVFFKLATPAGGDPRSSRASDREGLVGYSLSERRLLFQRETWGHPSWHPDGRMIVEKGNRLIDSDTGQSRKIPGLPGFRGDHPSASPDGRLVVTDTTLEHLGGRDGEWGIVVFDIAGDDFVIIHRFNNSGGARSWRRSHPHPVFSSDGQRIYFNVSSGNWTKLYVARCSAD